MSDEKLLFIYQQDADSPLHIEIVTSEHAQTLVEEGILFLHQARQFGQIWPSYLLVRGEVLAPKRTLELVEVPQALTS